MYAKLAGQDQVASLSRTRAACSLAVAYVLALNGQSCRFVAMA